MQAPISKAHLPVPVTALTQIYICPFPHQIQTLPRHFAYRPHSIPDKLLEAATVDVRGVTISQHDLRESDRSQEGLWHCDQVHG